MSFFNNGLSAAVGLTEYVLGTNTTTSSDTSSKTSSSNQANTDISQSQTTVNSADPSVIASLKSLAATATNNANNPTSQTTGLLTGILQQATDAMTSVFGKQSQSGIYNSSAAATQNNDILSRAAADAAQAILNYSTTEQGVASTALQQLLTATATNTQTGNTSTSVSGSSTSNTAGTSQSNQQTGLSIICGWMYIHGMLDKELYKKSLLQFSKLQPYSRQGYYLIAEPVLDYIHATKGKTLLAKFILSLFYYRTNQVAGIRSLKGWLSRAFVATICFPFCLWFYGKKKLSLFRAPKQVEG